MGLDQRVEADHRDGPEEQHEDAAHDRRGDGGKHRAQLADEGQADGPDGRPGHDRRVVGLRQGDSAGDLRIGGVGRPAEEGGHGGGDAVAQHGVLNAGVLHIVPAGDRADGDDIAEMLDGRGQRHRQHVENSLPAELREGEMRHGEPWRLDDGREVDDLVTGHGHDDGGEVAGDRAGEDGNDAEDALALDGHQNGGQQRYGGEEDGGAVIHQLGRPVTRLANGQIDGHRREDEADDHDDRAGDGARQKALQPAAALDAHHGGQGDIDQTGGGQPAQRGGKPPCLGGVDDGRDEGEGRAQEDRHLAARDELKDERAQPCGEQRHGGIEPRQDGHQHQRAKGDEQHLPADEPLTGMKAVFGLREVLVHDFPLGKFPPHPAGRRDVAARAFLAEAARSLLRGQRLGARTGGGQAALGSFTH